MRRCLSWNILRMTYDIIYYFELELFHFGIPPKTGGCVLTLTTAKAFHVMRYL